jgi:hypothetical protein
MEFVLYKPNKSQTGCAVKFNIHKSGEYAFMQLAHQFAPFGSKQMFKWRDDDRIINIKLGRSDLNAFWSVVNRLVQQVDLHHKTENDNKQITLSNNPEKGGYALKVSHQKISDKQNINRAFIGFKYEEVGELVRFINRAIDCMLESNVYTGNAGSE